jgi:N-acetylneuraminic acid mutarotase
MTHPWPLHLGLTLSVLGIVACGETTTPTQPSTAEAPAPGALWSALASNSWTTKAPFPASYNSGIAAGVRNNSAGVPIVYVFGGNYFEFQNDAISAYNPVANVWTTKASQFEGTETNGVGLISGKLYISGGYNLGGGGGFTSESMVRNLWVYDPAADRVTDKAPMPRQTAEGVTGVINAKLYVLSGICADDAPPVFDCDDPTFNRLLYRYDPATNIWTTLPPAPRSHRGGVGGVVNGKFYVAGGGGSTALDVYDPAANTWRRLASLPQSLCCTVGAVMNSKLWVVGWYASNRNTYAYDPVTNTWKSRAPLPVGTVARAAVSLPFDGHSHLFVVGGSENPEDEPAPSLLYTP